MEFDSDPKLMRSIHIGSSGNIAGVRPALIRDPGNREASDAGDERTILDAYQPTDLGYFREALRVWAGSVWQAWTPYHELARLSLRTMSRVAKARQRTRKKR